MSYTIEPRLLPYTDKKGLQKVCIYVYCNGVQAYPGTEVKIKKEQWKEPALKVVDHPQKEKMNAILAEKKNMYEGRLLEALKTKSHFTKPELLEILTGKQIKPVLTFTAFAYSYIDEMANKLSTGRIRHYNSIVNKILLFDDKVQLSAINGTWLQKFENWLFTKKLSSNTINTNIKIVKAIVRAAENKGLIETNFKGYKNPRLVQAEPDFLLEEEIQAFFALARNIVQPGHKLAAYYFLLSCFTGLRISDAKRFKYSAHVQGDEIIVRAKKNNKLVTIGIYTDLLEVLEYIKDKPLYLSEQKTRKFVKELCLLAGIKKQIQYKTARHSAASLFKAKGFDRDEVAEILGDSVAVTSVYLHYDRKQLADKVRQKMG